MSFPLSTAFIVSQRFGYVVPSFSLNSNKINSIKSVAFLYSKDKQAEKEIREMTPCSEPPIVLLCYKMVLATCCSLVVNHWNKYAEYCIPYLTYMLMKNSLSSLMRIWLVISLGKCGYQFDLSGPVADRGTLFLDHFSLFLL